jgi:tRNA dimethylallyltransferase
VTDDPTSPAAPLCVLTGPTAAGKSALALALAERQQFEILSMDSMAVYRRMDIGTAKPDAAERRRVPHWLIDLVEPSDDFDTARWCEHAAAAVADVRARGRQPLFVGGTPLYLMAFFKGLLQGPAADPELRAALLERETASPGSLHDELLQRDPTAAARIHRKDHKRLVRALEVVTLTGKPISAQQDHFARDGWARDCRIVGVSLPREQLHAAVKARTEAMLDRGLLDETRAIRDSGGFSRTAAGAIGYAECLDFLRGRYKDREELRNRIRRGTHQLIRRQLTWLRRLRQIRWVAPDCGAEVAMAALQGQAGAAAPPA